MIPLPLPLIFQLLVLIAFVTGAIILVLHRVFISSIEGAKQRLERDAESARAREAELNRKIRQADEELSQRKKELDAVQTKMKSDLESEAVKHKEELIQKARSDADEIITKAQNAAEGIRKDIEKQMEMRIIDYSVRIIGEVLSKKAKGALEKDLIEEFIAQLAHVDMSKIGMDIRTADVVTVNGISEGDLKKIVEIVRSKIGREIELRPKSEAGHLSGVILKFGSLHLDGSLQSAVRDAAIVLKTEVDKGIVKK